MAGSGFSLFRDQKLKWIEQLAENEYCEIWRASAFELNPPSQFTISVLKEQIDDPESQQEFTELLTKASTVRHSALLPILGFSVSESFTQLPTIFYEFCSTETLAKAMSDEDSLTITEKLIVLSGIACASQVFEAKGLSIGPVCKTSVFLNSEKEPKICNYGISRFVSRNCNESAIAAFGALVMQIMSTKPVVEDEEENDEEESIECGFPIMPGFFVDLYSECDEENVSSLSFESVVRSFMSEGFIVEGADARAIHDYQVRVISPDFSKKMVIDMYQQSEVHRAQMDELQSTIEFLSEEIRKVKKEVIESREVDRAMYDMTQEAQKLRYEMSEMSFALKSFMKNENKVTIPLSLDKGGIFSYLIGAQKSPFEKQVIASQSSGDVYCIIDSTSPGNFSTGSGNYEWIQFEFARPINIVAAKIQSAHRAFMKTWSIVAINDAGKSQPVYETTDNPALNGSGKTATVDITATSSRIFRIEKYGKNWAGTNFARVKNVELYSDESGFEGGVFKTLLSRSGGDPHKADVIVTSSNFDFRNFHNLSPARSLCTLYDTEHPWIQFELTKGRAIVQGYRMQQLDDFPFDRWSVQVSNNGEEWFVLDRRQGNEDSNPLKIVKCEMSMAFKIFRVICEMEGEDNDVKLRLRHFDIFGVYLDVVDTSQESMPDLDLE